MQFMYILCGKVGIMEENISFARKYRPTTVEGYVGNENVKSTVREYLKNGRPQTILLSGNSGCGKTTLARLLVKEYLCENRDEVKGACGKCSTCMAIDEYITTGSSDMLPDLYEIDASDKSGKKDINAVLDTMEYPPMAGDWKAYIIDEIHLLSEGAMGRMLKPIEEPPEGVLLIFCTTNPEKLLPTIRNRCQLKLKVSKPKIRDIVSLLQGVCLNEDKNYDIQGLRMLASTSECVVRDSLNNLETVLNTAGNATGDAVSKQFGVIADKIIFEFYQCFKNKDYVGYLNLLYKIKTSFGFEQFLVSLSNFTIRGIYVMNSVDVDGLSEEELISYSKLFKQFSVKEISFILSSLKKMNVGDIESNLFSFIYSDVGDKEVMSSVNVTEVPIEVERSMRNDNLQRIEDFKLKEGKSSLNSEMATVGFSDMAELFSLEKVE